MRRSGPEVYQAAEHMAPAVGAGYRKLARLAPPPAAERGRESAREAQGGMAALGYARPAPRPGYRVQVLDGNARAATAPRLKERRAVSGGALPGPAVGVYESVRNRRVDGVPGAAGQAQERARRPARVNTVQRGAVGMGEGHVGVTDCRVGIAERGADFLVRAHQPGRVPPQQAMGPRGRVETGPVAEQRVRSTRAGQPTLAVRRVAVRLEPPTRDGDRPVSRRTQLPPAVAAAVVAQASRSRGTWETAFQRLATALLFMSGSEVNAVLESIRLPTTQ